MKKVTLIIGLVLICIIGTVYWKTGQFSGDGIYKKEGIIFIDDLLALPQFPLDQEGKYSFSFKNLKASNIGYRPSLIITSPEEIPFWDIDTNVEIEVRKSSSTIFSFGGPLNSHYTQMWEIKESSWPEGNEWFARYKYADEAINRHAVPFDPNNRPVKLLSMNYTSIGKIIPIEPRTFYSIVITVSNPDSRYKGLMGQLSLSSGWK